MAALAARIERWLLLLVLGFSALGLAWPAPARAAVDRHGITVALVVLVAAVGLGLPASAVREVRRQAGAVAVAVFVPIVALPAIAWAASRLVSPGPLRLGVLAAGVAPSEVAAVALASLAGGSATAAAAVLIGSTAGCVLLAGPLLHLLAGPANTFSGTALLLSLLGIVAVPLVVGTLARAGLPGRADGFLDALSSVGASVAVLVLIWLVAGQAHLGLPYLRAGGALLLYLAGSLLVALAVTARLSRPLRISLVLPVAMRDFAIAAGIASQAFGPSAAGALGIYGVLVLLLGAGAARVGSAGH